MSERITDVKIGDVVTCYDEYSRDGEEHLMTVESIEKDKEYACEDNPEGIVLYGQDLEYDEDDDNYVSVVHSGNFIGICDEKSNSISKVMYNSSEKRVSIIDNDFIKVDPDKFKTLDFSDSEIMRFNYEDSWNLRAILSYEKSKELVDSVYKEYLSKVASWLDAAEMTTDVSLRSDGTVVVDVSAEQFISSDNINTAYVESYNLKGEKGDIVRDKLMSRAKEKGYNVSNIRPKKAKTDMERD